MPYKNNMIHFFQSFFKGIYDLGGKSIAFLYAYLAPLHGNLLTIYLLLICDLISGITKARKKGEPITAAKLSLTLYKFFFYSLIIILAFQIDVHTFLSTSLYLTHIVCYYIVMVEFKSNAENVSEITGIDLWIAVKERVLELFNMKIDKVKKKSDEE